jgi:hypothetical protein
MEWRRVADFTITDAAVALLMGNLIDAVVTLLLLQLRAAEELNPLMRWAYEGSPLIFIAAKIAMVHLSVLLLCFHRRTPMARMAERLSAMFYSALAVHQIFCIAQVLA